MGLPLPSLSLPSPFWENLPGGLGASSRTRCTREAGRERQQKVSRQQLSGPCQLRQQRQQQGAKAPETQPVAKQRGQQSRDHSIDSWGRVPPRGTTMKMLEKPRNVGLVIEHGTCTRSPLRAPHWGR